MKRKRNNKKKKTFNILNIPPYKKPKPVEENIKIEEVTHERDTRHVQGRQGWRRRRWKKHKHVKRSFSSSKMRKRNFLLLSLNFQHFCILSIQMVLLWELTWRQTYKGEKTISPLTENAWKYLKIKIGRSSMICLFRLA